MISETATMHISLGTICDDDDDGVGGVGKMIYINQTYIYNRQFIVIQNKYCMHVASGCLSDTNV